MNLSPKKNHHLIKKISTKIKNLSTINAIFFTIEVNFTKVFVKGFYNKSEEITQLNFGLLPIGND